MPLDGRAAARRGRGSWRRIALVGASLFLIIAYANANTAILWRLDQLHTVTARCVYLGLHVIALGLLVSLAFCSAAIAYPALLVFSLSVVIDKAHLNVRKHPLLLSDLDNLLISAGNTSDAVKQFRGAVIEAVIAAVLLAGSVLMLRVLLRRRRFATRGAIAAILAGFLRSSGLQRGQRECTSAWIQTPVKPGRCPAARPRFARAVMRVCSSLRT